MNPFRKFSPNQTGKDYVCSDIHGCFSELEKKLSSINFDESNDRVFCVGDLVDRGPESTRCTEFIAKDWFFSVYGNHEELLCSNDVNLHKCNGGQWFYTLGDIEQDEIRTQLQHLPLMIQVGEYGLIHAELPVNINDWKDAVKICQNDYNQHNMKDSLIWGRTRYTYSVDTKIENIKNVYVGHTIVKKPRLLGNTYYIDTGAFLNHYGQSGGHITMRQLEHND